MKTLIDHLAQYAAYHRDPRNIHTHFVGVPMIMFAVVVLLSRPVWWLGMVPVSPALACAVAAGIFYLRLDVRLGLVMSALLAAMLAGAAAMAPLGTTAWLAWGLGLFAVGWVIQFVGHYYEGRKPAFVDDVMGLLVGPLFVVAEWGFALGLRAEVQHAVEQRGVGDGLLGVHARHGAEPVLPRDEPVELLARRVAPVPMSESSPDA